MLVYTLKRLALIVPTLFGILLVNFLIVQAAPGGPVDQMVAQLQGLNVDSTASLGGTGAGENIQVSNNNSNRYGISQDVIDKIEKMYGFDKPPSERFWEMVKNYAQFNFGESFFRSETVIELIKERLPVSISLGLWSTLLIYMISIPLGIKKAVSHGSRFDISTSTVVTIAYAIPGFLFAIMLIVLFAGGSYWKIFPLRGLYSDHFDQMAWYQQIGDYLWHIFLPVLCYSISGFAQLTLLTKNSFLEEIHKQYALTAKAKGLNEKQVLYRHLFRNSMLVIIAGFPAAFAAMFFTGSMLIEYIFSLEGIGLLGFESVIRRDYPIVFGTLFIFSLINLLLKIVSDLMYVLIDPRINFESHHAV